MAEKKKTVPVWIRPAQEQKQGPGLNLLKPFSKEDFPNLTK